MSKRVEIVSKVAEKLLSDVKVCAKIDERNADRNSPFQIDNSKHFFCTSCAQEKQFGIMTCFEQNRLEYISNSLKLNITSKLHYLQQIIVIEKLTDLNCQAII